MQCSPRCARSRGLVQPANCSERGAARGAQTVRGRTAAAGATDTNQLVALPDFYARHIAPELAAADVNERAVIKADALKFITTFRGQARRNCLKCQVARLPRSFACYARTSTLAGVKSKDVAVAVGSCQARNWCFTCCQCFNLPDCATAQPPRLQLRLRARPLRRAQLPKATCLDAFPHLVRLLGAEANVVHSYAAIAIDRLLTQKARAPPPQASSRSALRQAAGCVPVWRRPARPREQRCAAARARDTICGDEGTFMAAWRLSRRVGRWSARVLLAA